VREGGQHRHRSASAQDLVVGVGGDDHDAGPVQRSAAGKCFSPAHSSQASSAVPGRSMWFRVTCLRCGLPRGTAGGHELAELSQITFGVMLPQVHRQVRDPAGMRLVVAKRPGPQRAAHPVHDLGGRRLDQRT